MTISLSYIDRLIFLSINSMFNPMGVSILLIIFLIQIISLF